MTDTSRREFINLIACSACAGAATAALSGCAGAAMYPTSVQNGAIRVPIVEFDGLTQLDDDPRVLVVMPQASQSIILVNDGEQWKALSSRCPHMGCEVHPSGSALVCPCHGSTFTLSGEVTRGPAVADLADYAVQLVDGVIEISVETGA